MSAEESLNCWALMCRDTFDEVELGRVMKYIVNKKPRPTLFDDSKSACRRRAKPPLRLRVRYLRPPTLIK
jgi:hypothetical protein